MKKELLFVVDEREMGGVSVVLNDLVHMLDSLKYEIDILVLHDKGKMLTDLPENVKLIVGTPYFEAIDYTIGQVLHKKDPLLLLKKIRIVFDLKTGHIRKSILKERKKIIKKNYDVEIAFKDGFTALFTACGNTPKKIHWLHCSYKTNNPNEKYEKLFLNILNEFDHIVGVANNVVSEFNEIYHLENKTEVIPPVMDTKRIISLSKMNPLVSIDPHQLNVALVGRCHPVKGYDRFFDVLLRLKEEGLLENVHFVLYGDGPLFDHLSQRLQEDHLEKYVMMANAVSNPYAELKQYSFLLLPSFSEAFGTVITEAFLVGIPVLSTKTSASLMSIEEEVNGWICENSEEGIYQGLKDLILNQKQIEKCKDHLKQYSYDNEKLLRRIDTIFDEKEQVI